MFSQKTTNSHYTVETGPTGSTPKRSTKSKSGAYAGNLCDLGKFAQELSSNVFR